MNSYYRVEPHWHVTFGRTETLIYSKDREEITEWLRQQAIVGAWLFDVPDPRDFEARWCVKNDCRPRPRRVETLEEFLQHPTHGWWCRISLGDLV